MNAYHRSTGIPHWATVNTCIRGAGICLALLVLPFDAHSALSEFNGNNPYTLSPRISVGSHADFGVILKNTGATTVNLTSVMTTGPFALQSNSCGSSLASGASCSGNIMLRFAPIAAGTATGTLVVGNDSAEGTFTLNLVATGTSLIAPTLTAVFNPNQIYSVTGVSALMFTLANPNAVALTPQFLNVPLPSGFQTTANPNPITQCGGGNWYGPANGSPASQSAVYFSGDGMTSIPPNGSCVISIDIASSNAPGTYIYTPDPFLTTEVLGAIPASGAALTIITPIAGAPGAPTVVSATSGNAQATVIFTPPSDIGSSPITGYTVTSRPLGGIDSNAGSTGLSHVVSGLVNGSSYTFSVTATNTAGAGVPSAQSNAVTPATTPGAPTNVIATAGNGSGIVTFSAPANGGGNTITGYLVTSSPLGGTDSNAGSLSFSHVITGLANGTVYTFKVTAANALGIGAQSAASNPVSPAIPVVGTPRQITYQVTPTRSAIPTSTPVVPPGPRVQASAFAYNAPRSFAYADFNGDGFVDIFYAPAYSQYPPFFPVEIWLNNGNGTFRNGTSEVIDGVPPLTANPSEVFVADFNEDGRPDIFVVDQGVEFATSDGSPTAGFLNTLLLSQPNGRLTDATVQIVPNPRIANHQGGIGDFNGDGHLDLAVNRGSTPLINNSGISLIIGDGQGNLVETTAGLSQDIAFIDESLRRASDYQGTGCAALVDLDGDGRADLITGSYSAPDRGVQHTRTIRFQKSMPNGTAVERGRVTIPDAIANIEYGYDPTPPDFAGLGCSQILPADLNGDGRPDLIIQWEGAGKWYIEILRNDGNFQFTDITLEALGGYSTTFGVDGPVAGPGKIKVLDLNGDGTLDLVYAFNGTSLTNILRHVAMLNDGTAHFMPWKPQVASGDLTDSDILPTSLCTSCSYIPLFTKMTNNSQPSLVVLDYQSDLTSTVPIQTKTVFITTISPVPTSTVPGAPTNAVATVGDGQATVTFSAPASTGGSAIINYTATCGTRSATSTALAIAVSGLTNGVPVTCIVTAANAIGGSLPSSPSNSVTPVGLTLLGVQSRKTHGGAGIFNMAIDTSLIAPKVTVEPRAIGGGHTIVFQFNRTVASIGNATATDSNASPLSATPAIANNEVTVTLTGVADNRRVTVSLTGVNGALDVSASVGFLVGDVTNSRSVNASDISAVKASLNKTLDINTYKFDLNATGSITPVDVSAVKARSGLVLPP